MDGDDKIKTIADISYCGYEIPNIHLEANLSDFKKQFINEFSLQEQINEDDEMSIYYKQEEKKIEVQNQSDYKNMLDNFLNSKSKQVIYVDTKKIPVYFSGKKSIEFEDEIKNVVERELRIAANNIKKCLTTNLSLSNSKKVRTQCCEKCQEQIIGYLYKKVSPTENNAYYCELCSTTIEEPMFKIN